MTPASKTTRGEAAGTASAESVAIWRLLQRMDTRARLLSDLPVAEVDAASVA